MRIGGNPVFGPWERFVGPVEIMRMVAPTQGGPMDKRIVRLFLGGGIISLDLC